jgi:hypothetical protein
MRPSEPSEDLDLTTSAHDWVVVLIPDILIFVARLDCALVIAFGETLVVSSEELG